MGVFTKLLLTVVLAVAVSTDAFSLRQALAAGSLPVPGITIYPGEEIRAEHLRDRRFPDRFLSAGGYVTRREDVIGKMARRTLIRGKPIPLNAIRKPYAVRSGKAVTLVYRSGGLTIAALATALKSASVGELVQVRNVDSGRIIHGVVQPDGSVLVMKR